MRYAIWNNKGGVGKSFLTLMLATEWARKNPDARVLVVDMCPQANVSEMLLGGNGIGHTTISKFVDESLTIGGYFDSRILSPHKKTGGEKKFCTLVSQKNKNIPSNLYLVVGDPVLELQVQTINNISVQEMPANSWENVHSWVKDLIEGIVDDVFEKREFLCLIDCNPSFASYTEQAIIAAQRLIVPCSPDGSSARAITNLARLVYGIGVPKNYQNVGFNNKVEHFRMKLPTPHLILSNRTTQYGEQPSKAFQSMFDQIKQNVKDFVKELNDDIDVESLFFDMPDAHTVAIVASSLGKPLHLLKAGHHKLRNDQITQINKGPLDRYKDCLAQIVEEL